MSLNTVILQGRLVADPEVRYTQGDNSMCVARYRLAVNRDRKDQDGNYTADFISCTAFGRAGEFAEKFLTKGVMVNVTGRWQTGSYTNKDGVKVYTNECVVQNQYFCESKGSRSETDNGYNQNTGNNQGYGQNNGYNQNPSYNQNSGYNQGQAPASAPAPQNTAPQGYQQNNQQYSQNTLDGFMSIPDDIDEELPFT